MSYALIASGLMICACKSSAMVSRTELKYVIPAKKSISTHSDPRGHHAIPPHYFVKRFMD
jgi:hypothetical protein